MNIDPVLRRGLYCISMYELTDTHAHLCLPDFAADLDAVLARARAAGVSSVIAVGETLEDARLNLALAEEHPMIRPAAGLYPAHLDRDQAEQLCALIRAHREEFVAIGEVGLDHWVVKEEEQRRVQRQIFSLFIDLARELDLPLNVHSRSAGRHAVELLTERGARRVQMHAFDGKASTARPAIEAGYYFSLPPSLIHSKQKQKLLKHLPLDCLLLETDSPVLGPDRAVRNEPANLIVALEAIAQGKDLAVEQVAETIRENTQRLYES